MTEDTSKKRKTEDHRPPDEDIEVDDGPSDISGATKKRQKIKVEEDDVEIGHETSETRSDKADEMDTNVDGSRKKGAGESTKATAETASSKQTETEVDVPPRGEDPPVSKRDSSTKSPYETLCWTIIKNDGRPESLIKLVALKSLFSKQLPKMPKPYIARLVFDWRHISLVILSDDPKVKDTDKEVIGSICYRPFPEMRFAEIAFCAVNSDHQVQVSDYVILSHLSSVGVLVLTPSQSIIRDMAQS